MKKLFAIVTILAGLTFGMTTNVMAQEQAVAADSSQVDVAVVDEVVNVPVEETVIEEVGMHKALKTKFMEGGAGFMSLVLFCLIFGLALCIERIIYLNMSSINTKRLLSQIDDAWTNGGVNAAMEVCRNTRGPVAAIFYQGLSRYHEGVEVVEKSVASYGSVQLGLFEKNLSWISLFIALAPMLGFMGTVIGMIEAFDKIQQAGDISATILAGGIKVALLTTVLVLIVSIILPIFYNYILSLLDGFVTELVDSSISLLSIVVKHSPKN